MFWLNCPFVPKGVFNLRIHIILPFFAKFWNSSNAILSCEELQSIVYTFFKFSNISGQSIEKKIIDISYPQALLTSARTEDAQQSVKIKYIFV